MLTWIVACLYKNESELENSRLIQGLLKSSSGAKDVV